MREGTLEPVGSSLPCVGLQVVERDPVTRTTVQLAPQQHTLVKLIWGLQPPPSLALLVAKHSDVEAESFVTAVQTLVSWLAKRGVRLLSSDSVILPPTTLSRVDFIVCVGGDGSLLKAAALFGSDPCPPTIALGVPGGSSRWTPETTRTHTLPSEPCSMPSTSCLMLSQKMKLGPTCALFRCE